ncbi:MAG TPA: hypothetical protein VK436_16745 [Methanocella sp.]|nr:hypothetical protein [Methanocella sp.]
MIKVAIQHRVYSQNKVKIKNVIKKYGMSWDSGRNGWVNSATGDGVYIDKSIMDMILSDSFSSDKPMTMFIDSGNREFLAEMEAMCKALGGELTYDVIQEKPGPGSVSPQAIPVRKSAVVGRPDDIFVRLKIRDHDGCNTKEFSGRAMMDLRGVDGRWDRRKSQVLEEYKRLGLDRETVEKFIRREEIAFRKHNACWVTGDFSDSEKAMSGDPDDK